jgi:hypothetical protein
MVCDDLATLGLEVGVVDAEAIVEPVYFAFDEIAGDEALREGDRMVRIDGSSGERQVRTLVAMSCSTCARCSSLPLKMGVVYPGAFSTRWFSPLPLWRTRVAAERTLRVGSGADIVGWGGGGDIGVMKRGGGIGKRLKLGPIYIEGRG